MLIGNCYTEGGNCTMIKISHFLCNCFYVYCMCVINRGSVMALTSVADVRESSWFLSEIRAAELSALQSVNDHRCCYLCFQSPGAQQHTHKLFLNRNSHNNVMGTSRAFTNLNFGLQHKPEGLQLCICHNGKTLHFPSQSESSSSTVPWLCVDPRIY